MSDSNELARERTDWAEDRTVLANERTYAGWMRTGMAAIALALGLRALFGAFEPTWVPKLVASLFVLTGVMIFVAAWRSACRTLARLDDHTANAQTSRRISAVTGVLCVAGLATGVILLLL